MTLGEWLKDAQSAIVKARGEDYHSDAGWLLAETLGLRFSALKFEKDRYLTVTESEDLNAALARRVSGEPLQYILETEGFMGLPFHVDRRVLIPRADTETLCEYALNALKGIKRPRVLDMCTGSGAIAVSIAKLRPDAHVTACDISRDALDVARLNARLNGADIEFCEGDLFAPVTGREFDAILINPPYLTRADMDDISAEVRCEPSLALFGGDDGLDFYRRIALNAPPLIARGGFIAMEVGADQAQPVAALFPELSSGTVKDLGGIERVVHIRRKSDADSRL